MPGHRKMLEMFLEAADGFPIIRNGENASDYTRRIGGLYKGWILESGIHINPVRMENAVDIIEGEAFDRWHDHMDMLAGEEEYEYEELMTESNFKRLKSKWQRYHCGVISAFKDRYGLKKNRERNRELRAALNRHYSVTKVGGGYCETYREGDEHKYYDLDDEERCKNKGELGKWVKEESAFVADIDDPHGDGERLKEDLIYFGKRYDQDGVLFLPLYDDYVFEIDPETSEMEKKGRKSKVLEVMQKLTGGYTRIRNRFFQFSEVREIPMLSWFDTISERISYQRHFNSGKTLEEMQKKRILAIIGEDGVWNHTKMMTMIGMGDKYEKMADGICTFRG